MIKQSRLEPILEKIHIPSFAGMEGVLYKAVVSTIPSSWISEALKNVHEQQVVKRADKQTTPESLILYVNMTCNARCAHCFIWKLLNTGIYEMKVEEFEKIAASLEQPVRLLITGGEPFLRPDLYDIAYAFEKQGILKSLQIVTNASMPKLIDEFVSKWIQETNKKISLQISVDGLEKTHDTIRKIPNGFKKILETIDILEKFPKNRVSVKTSSTVHKQNKNEVFDLIRFFQKRKIHYKFTIMRSNSCSTFGLPRRILSGWDHKAEMIALKSKDIQDLVRAVDQNFPGYLDASTRAKLLISATTLEKKRRQIPCFAGSLEAVIHADGKVSHCEQVKPFGNLRDVNFNFKKLWWSDKASAQRRIISKCSCIHGCNLWTSITKTHRDVFYRQPLV